MTALDLTIETRRLVTELVTLAMISDPVEPTGEGVAVTRIVFTPTDLKAREFVEQLAAETGLSIRRDPVGNTFFRWQGSDPTLAPIATGSHIDAIPNAGMYDGTVGVLGAIEALRALRATGFEPKRSIDIILFTSEEPTRFGIGCLGSRLLSGTLTATDARALTDANNQSLEAVRTAANFAGELEEAQLQPGTYAAFIELHIEQGPLLEQANTPIGIVTAIAAPASWRITIAGEGGHAGAMLMAPRHDALVAASEIIQAVEAAALRTNVIDTVATVGMCEVFPGAVNSVPSRVRLSLDVRDTNEPRRNTVLDEISAACTEVAKRRGVSITHEILNADAPATSSPAIIQTIEEACAAEAITYEKMVSRAYHDSLFMARIAPIGMIFIPCRNGVSHRPDEYASPEDIARGVAVLARTLAHLSST